MRSLIGGMTATSPLEATTLTTGVTMILWLICPPPHPARGVTTRSHKSHKATWGSVQTYPQWCTPKRELPRISLQWLTPSCASL